LATGRRWDAAFLVNVESMAILLTAADALTALIAPISSLD